MNRFAGPFPARRTPAAASYGKKSTLARVGGLIILLCAAFVAVNVCHATQHLHERTSLEAEHQQRNPSLGWRRSGGDHVNEKPPSSDPEERACAELLSATSKIMFMVLGGRGYHAVRVRTILHSWARCVKHVLVFTDPSANISGYPSPRRHVYLSAGDAWKRRPYLPMTHMDTVGRIMGRREASGVQWFFMVTDRTFVDVRALLRLLPPLDPTAKGYYGQVANMAHKEAFGFHDYVDLNTGVLLSRRLLERIVDPGECHDQKSAGGTFDMFDAKLGNCAYFLSALPQPLVGFSEAEAPRSCGFGEGVGGVVSFGKVEPAQMVGLSSCAGLISESTARQIAATAAAEEHPQLSLGGIAVHVMARETHLRGVIDTCESTWAKAFPLVYYHVDKGVALDNKFAISRGAWSLSPNLLPPEATASADAADDGIDPAGARAAAAAAYGGGGLEAVGVEAKLAADMQRATRRPLREVRRHRVAALNLPERPDAGGEHWKISHDKGMGWNTWLRFKMRGIFEWSVRASWRELANAEWHVYVDDDTCTPQPHTPAMPMPSTPRPKPSPGLGLLPPASSGSNSLHVRVPSSSLPLSCAQMSSTRRCWRSSKSTIRRSRTTLAARCRRRATLPLWVAAQGLSSRALPRASFWR